MHRIAALGALVVLLFLPSGAPAQPQQEPPIDWHIYGGGVLGGKEYTRGGFAGAAGSTGVLYMGIDGHVLRLDDAGQVAFQQLAIRSGADLALATYGMDLSVGGVIGSSADGRSKLIPFGLIGYTRADLEACIYETFCDEESATQVNFGAGFAAALSRFHVGFRYTRNYGVAISVGVVFRR